MKDTYKHKGLRRQLVESLKKKGIADEAVLAAIETIPRHFFLEKAFDDWAYKDKAFPIGNDQTISQPFTVAYQTVLLDIKKRDKVMEIGTGSGYQAAILAALGARVFTIERQEALFQKATILLRKMGINNIRTFYKDGYKGLPEFAPFDKIIVTAGATEIPQVLCEQLKIDGVMVIPVGDKDGQKMLKITRKDIKVFEKKYLDNFRFVPFLKGVEGKK